MLFWQKSDNGIGAPVNGICEDIVKCKDLTFSKKLLGDGFLIHPVEDIICSPCDGVLSMVFPTRHAFGIKTNDGREILVHIGIDTVNLNGECFKQLKQINSKVKRGTPVVSADVSRITELGYDPSVMVVLTNSGCSDKKRIGETVQTGDIIIEEKYENNKKHQQ